MVAEGATARGAADEAWLSDVFGARVTGFLADALVGRHGQRREVR